MKMRTIVASKTLVCSCEAFIAKSEADFSELGASCHKRRVAHPLSPLFYEFTMSDPLAASLLGI